MKDLDLKAYATYAEMQDIVNSFGKQSEVAAVIYGKKYRLNEYQVRALQIMCKRAGERGDDAWQEFVDNVIVYNLPAWIYDDDEPFEFYDPNTEDEDEVPTDIHQMIFRKDGIFENEFGCDDKNRCGFYNRTADMAFELF